MRKQSILVGFAALAALTACSSAKSARNAAQSTAAPATGAPAPASTPNCNGESPVWAIGGAKVYLVPGDRLYGRTKRGQFLCLSQAQSEGYRAARRPGHQHHRHDKLFSV